MPIVVAVLETADNNDFLAEMMELNEQVAATNDSSGLHSMLDEVNKKIHYLGSQLKVNFEMENLSAAKEVISKLTFYRRLKTAISRKIMDCSG